MRGIEEGEDADKRRCKGSYMSFVLVLEARGSPRRLVPVSYVKRNCFFFYCCVINSVEVGFELSPL